MPEQARLSVIYAGSVSPSMMNRLLYALAIATAITMMAAVAVAPAALLKDSATAQELPSLPTFSEITGKYENEEAGIEITLPAGWRGIALPAVGGAASVMASPEGIGAEESPTSFMMVSMIDKASVEENTVPESAQRPTNVPEDAQVQCEDPTVEPVQVNGMDGIVSIIECTVEGDVYKTKMYSFQTEERFYTVGYTATSETAYDENVGAFDDSVDTLRIENTIEAPAIPEFPIAAVIAAAAAVSIAVVAGRARFARLF